jgi:DNA mismatch repair protein MutS2
MRALEWPKILELLALRAHSSMGAERCRNLALESDLEEARTRLQETADMARLQEHSDPFPALAFPDTREGIGRAIKGATLETHELRDLSVTLEVGLGARRFLTRRIDEVPALAAAARPLEEMPQLQRLKHALDRCVDPEGNIRESATPALHRLSQHAQDLKQTMRRRLEVILATKRFTDVLQEQYFAQREGRYVLPVKAELRSRIPGIVHDVSASGATVFLEPRELVELNNSIKVAELEVQREINRILQELSGQVAAESVRLFQILQTLGVLDCIAAKAALGRVVKGEPIALNTTGRIVLRQARHPLLVLARDAQRVARDARRASQDAHAAAEAVVANDIVLDDPVRVLVISGPNTGGKTVTLKVLGLSALMVRAGLFPPCGPDSEMPLFQEVYADIGDTQDLAKDLSSFSAHMIQMIRIMALMEQASKHRPSKPPETGLPVLILIDELATSTDPTEGAALAEALLKRLATLGLKVVVTTHYNSLKTLAQTTPGFMNASVEFDVATLSPTFRLLLGLPGGSSALDIAGRLGMDSEILEDARRLLKREDRLLERVLGELQEKQRRLDVDTERAGVLRAEAERSAQEAAEITDRLRATEREEQKRIRKVLTEELMRARADVQAVLEGLKRERTLHKAKEAKQRVAEIEAQAGPQLRRSGDTISMEELDAGAKVEIGSLGAVGTLLESPRGKKRVRVRVGEREMSVAVSALLGLSHAGPPPGRKAQPSRAVSSSPSVVGYEAASQIDVRGKNADEALDMVIAALDQAMLAGAPTLRIIHGHGTGRLKAALREHLKTSAYVATFRPGARAEGGDGVTIVELN